jgi:hypothetical protein
VTRERPWWASDGPVEGGLDTSEDPVERIRHARRGGDEDPAGRTGPGDVPPGGGRAGDGGDLPFTDEPGADDAGGPRGRPAHDDHADDPTGGVGGGRDLPPAGPWWEAAAETVSRLARDLAETAEAQDPEARGEAGARPRHDAAGGDDGDPGAPDGGPADARDAHRIDACGICPICVGLRTLGESRPELVGHLAEAARHVALAARSLAARPAPGSPDDEPLQHIGLDD